MIWFCLHCRWESTEQWQQPGAGFYRPHRGGIIYWNKDELHVYHHSDVVNLDLFQYRVTYTQSSTVNIIVFLLSKLTGCLLSFLIVI